MEHIIIQTLFNWLLTALLLWTPKDWIVAICEIVLVYMIINRFRRKINEQRNKNKIGQRIKSRMRVHDEE